MRLITFALLAWGLILGSSVVQASPLISSTSVNLAHFNSAFQSVRVACGGCGYPPQTHYRHLRRDRHQYPFPPRIYFDYFGPLNPALRFYGCSCRS
jgi:hypothetical protein